ncbi:Putative hydrolase C777.06c [Durusdinium trenchii]|uniref:Hydrolase C777.06c n=1 Tax=Durusdinium trenchii TaxID=1381693 RepID=A0ABP0PQ92_9DINO
MATTALVRQGVRHAPRCNVAPPKLGSFDAVVLGSGVSTAVPQLSHILQGHCETAKAVRKADGLTVCEDAHQNPSSKNRRFNVSLLLRYSPPDGSRVRHVMVDAGKTLRQAALAALPQYGVRNIDALLVTHGHADAMLGMDDLRDLQVIEKFWSESGEHIGYQLADGAGPMQIISNKVTLDRVREAFPYLDGNTDFVRPGVLRRRIAYIEFMEVSDDETMDLVGGLPLRVFPVWHGGTYVSLGFAFGGKLKGGYPLVYISDIKDVPPKTMSFLEEAAAVGIDLFMVDALSRSGHPTHMSLDEALELVRKLRPKRTLLVGMDSCAMGDHDEVNEELRALQREGLDVQLAFDGQHLPEFPARDSSDNPGNRKHEQPDAKRLRGDKSAL